MPTELAEGAKAPAFNLPRDGGGSLSLADFNGRKLVLYFYPKADTPGCTKEACGFRDAIASYKKLNVPVFGVSPDPVEDVKNFADKFNLNFPLLADLDHKLADKFGAWREKNLYGKKSMGIVRSTFLIDEKGKMLV